MKTYYILYYYPHRHGMHSYKKYQTSIFADNISKARSLFIKSYPDAIIKGIEDYPPS